MNSYIILSLFVFYLAVIFLCILTSFVKFNRNIKKQKYKARRKNFRLIKKEEDD
jgi:uncharacterized protein YpmB